MELILLAKSELTTHLIADFQHRLTSEAILMQDLKYNRLVALVTLALVAMLTGQASAQQNSNTGPEQGRQVNLRQQLTAGLKARTKADFAFIDTVVKAVEQGRLPRTIVDTTFLWARERAAKRSYLRRLRPMVYFQPGLTERAKRLRITL